MDAKGIPLYAGPKSTSNCGRGLVGDDCAEAMVDAYAFDSVAKMGPVDSNPALKK